MTEAFVTQIGEGFAGTGTSTAHINTVLGALGGPVETAWATALAQPSPGHTPFMVVAQPGIAIKPLTLFVSKATVTTDGHGTITWGAAQAGVARGVIDAVALGLIDQSAVDELLLIAAVWVDPHAADAAAIFDNNSIATVNALRAGKYREPAIDDVLALRDEIWNPFFRSR